MKNLLFILLFILSNTAFTQEANIIEAEEINEETPFSVIENVPIYKGCDKNLSNRELKDCMSKKITEHVSANFNINCAQQTDLKGTVRVSVIFKIDKKGNVIDIRSRAPHPVLEQEAIRVIKLMPKMDRPGIQRGKPVIVPYALPIIFKIPEKTKPLTVSELQKLKRQQKRQQKRQKKQQ